MYKSNKRIDETEAIIKQKYPNITRDEAIIISTYTCEAYDKNYSPYKILNRNLTAENREEGLKTISKYFYLFLHTLRKLPRYYPKKDSTTLYRCIDVKVPLGKIDLKPKLIPYVKNNRKTFWAFTSSSPKVMDIMDTFLGNHPSHENMKYRTIFSFDGEIWGYDIFLFNYFKEKEILVEPERKFLIDEVLPLNDLIYVRCIFDDTPIILSENIINIKYEINKAQKYIKLFGGKFIQNNKSLISKITCNEKEFNFGNNLMYFDVSEYINQDVIEIKLDTSGITNMEYMFYECHNIIELSKNWKIKNIINTSHMFERCGEILSLDFICNWDVSTIKNMNSMFYGLKLQTLPDISNWDISNVTDIGGIFISCSSLLSLPDISRWNTSNVTNMCSIFASCSSLLSLPDISKWDLSNTTNISWMFKNCSSL